MSKEKGKSVLDMIKDRIAKSASGSKDFFYLGPDKKARIRFLNDFEDAFIITTHDKFGELRSLPCLKYFDRECEYCKRDDIRTRELYGWIVWNYETDKQEIFLYPANSFSPIPQLVSAYETYGTITDRDFVVNRKGSETNTTYGMMPLDKSKFKKKVKKLFTEEDVLRKMLEREQFDLDDVDFDEMDLEELLEFAKEHGLDLGLSKKDKKNEKKVRKAVKEAWEEAQEVEEDDEDEDDEDYDEDEDEEDEDDEDEDEDEEEDEEEDEKPKKMKGKKGKK